MRSAALLIVALGLSFIASACSSDDGSGLEANGAGVNGSNGIDGAADAAVGNEAGVDDADAGVRDARIDDPLCQFGGEGSQGRGEPCGCQNDCSGDEPICARELTDLLGDGYCTEPCGPGGTCPEAFDCAELGPLSFCQACLGGEPAGLDEPCRCDSDCGTVNVSGQSRQMSCPSGQCVVTGCVPTTALGCPDGQFCELVGLDAQCVTCINETPGAAGADCSCARDCATNLECVSGQCRTTCASVDDCEPGQECRTSVLGSSTCVEPAPTCTGSASLPLGSPCSCNADCAADAPLCLSTEILGGNNVGFCTRRPCDISSADACASESPLPFSCCQVPFVFPATCLPGPLADQLADLLTCGP